MGLLTFSINWPAVARGDQEAPPAMREWVGFQSRLLAMYALLIALGFHLRVLFGEEPWLARVHGEKWQLYKEQVPRWLGFRSGTVSAGRHGG